MLVWRPLWFEVEVLNFMYTFFDIEAPGILADNQGNTHTVQIKVHSSFILRVLKYIYSSVKNSSEFMTKCG